MTNGSVWAPSFSSHKRKYIYNKGKLLSTLLESVAVKSLILSLLNLKSGERGSALFFHFYSRISLSNWIDFAKW